MDIFEQLLEDLSKEMNVTLKEDTHHSCQIRFKDLINIQLELDKTQEHLILGTNLGELLPGKFRENVLREALKENGAFPPSIGIFAYSERKNTLILFEKRKVQDLSGKTIHELLKSIQEKAISWKQSIDRGDVPQSGAVDGSVSSHGSIFDIKK